MPPQRHAEWGSSEWKERLEREGFSVFWPSENSGGFATNFSQTHGGPERYLLVLRTLFVGSYYIRLLYEFAENCRSMGWTTISTWMLYRTEIATPLLLRLTVT